MKPSALHIRIDRVVLRGFDGVDASYTRALGRNLERELAALFTDFATRAATPDRAVLSRLQAPVFQVPYPPSSAQLGRALACALYDSLAACTGSESQGSTSP